MRQFGILVIFILVLLGCKETKEASTLEEGKWQGIMTLSESQELPFNFEISRNSDATYVMTVFNADERVVFDEVKLTNDSIRVKLSVFDGELLGTFEADKIKGQFVEESRDRVVPFSAFYGEKPRFKVAQEPVVDVSESGRWNLTLTT